MNDPVRIGDATLFYADCREILPTLTGVDAVVVDMPYGVMLGEVINGQALAKNQQPYSTFSDTPDYLKLVMIPALIQAIGIAKRALVFCGTRNVWLYPVADELGC